MKRLLTLVTMIALAVGAWGQETWNFKDKDAWPNAKVVTGEEVSYDKDGGTTGTNKVTFKFTAAKGYLADNGFVFWYSDGPATIPSDNYIEVSVPINHKVTFTFSANSSNGRPYYYTTDGANVTTLNATGATKTINYTNSGASAVSMKVWVKNNINNTNPYSYLETIVLEDASSSHHWTVNLLDNAEGHAALKSALTGDAAKDADYTFSLPKVIIKDSKFYVLNESSTQTDFHVTKTMGEADQEWTYYYTEDSDIKYYTELDATTNVNASNGGATYSSNPFTETITETGQYDMSFNVLAQGTGREQWIYVNDQLVKTFTGTSGLQTLTLNIVSASAQVKIKGKENGTATTNFIDYVLIKKTGDAVNTVITTLPTASAITYGDNLSASTLTGGVAKLGAEGEEIEGTFAWTAPETIPNVGSLSYGVTFTPTITSLYTTATCDVAVTVDKATPTITTAPTAATPTYTGEAQNLVTAGEVDGGTIYFSTTSATEGFDTAIPQETNAGSYNVWWKIVGDATHTDVAATQIADVKINPKAVTISGITASNKTYNGNTAATLVYTNLSVSGKCGEDEVSATAIGSFADKTVGTEKTVTLSDLTLTGAKAGNYVLAAEGQQTYTTANITALEATLAWENTTLTYDGTEKAPTATVSNMVEGDDVNVTVTGGQIEVGTDYTATASGLTGADAGNYVLPAEKTTTYSISASAATVTVAPAAIENLTYTGEAQALISAGTASGGTMQYSLTSSSGFSAEIPTATNAGNYTVYYMVVGDANHGNTDEASVAVTVAKYNITNATAANAIEDQTYTGNALTPDAPSIMMEETTIDTENYDVAYSNNIAVGTATVTYTAKEGSINFTGTKTLNFTIKRNLGVTLGGTQKWATYFSDINLAIPAGVTAYRVASVNGNTVNVEEVDYIKANRGVLLYSETAVDPEDLIVGAGSGTDYTSELLGSTSAGSMTSGTNYVLYNNQFILAEDTTLPANRCYIHLSGSATSRGLTIVPGNGNTTGIEDIPKDEGKQTKDQYYNMNGQRIDKPTKKGLYIVNGRKVVIK